MKELLDFEAFREGPEAEGLVRRVRELVDGPTALMEVCGTHTVAIGRAGIRSLVPEELRLLSGPGCPVCVTPLGEIDQTIEAARRPDVTVATFGDMMRVPGSESSLERERAAGADVRVVTSALDAVKLASEEPSREIVFIGVGFETTSPTVAAALLEAERRDVPNVSVFPFFKLVPPALEFLVGVPDRALDGFLCPGHVSSIIGSNAYEPVAREAGIPCVVTGFEPLDILAGIVMLLEQVRDVRSGGAARVETQYSRAVRPEGNPTARSLLDETFDTADAEWRGIGAIPASGYVLSQDLMHRDAAAKLGIERPEPAEPEGCICGAIMLGRKLPGDCPLFGTDCTPRDPVGPCMVSSEGSCAAHFRYEHRRST
ncbi:MAG: hydrogenase formation protein HypD [Candidatus Eisenbacteria bacterium]|nr:hydrogenase formation protein HypD [Candidatus Eisenbacteria bacterium]